MNFLNVIPNIDATELQYLNAVTKDLNPDQKTTFVALYNGKRKDPQHLLIGCIIGFVAIAGIQRFLVGQIGMGILYLFTAGFCLIGTIVDLINYKQMAFEYNQKMAVECMTLINIR
jgi:TM2 domain-containing membrane protein YozV